MITVESTEVSPELIKFINSRTGIAESAIAEMCKHNVLTINQVAVLSNKSISAAHQLIRPRMKADENYTVLTPAFPFPELDSEGNLTNGRPFVAKDQKFFEFIKKALS